MIINVKTSKGSYDIKLERGSLKTAGEFLNLNRRVFIVTDSGVPKKYSAAVKKQCKKAKVFTFKMGEGSKNISTLTDILREMVKFSLDRGDCVVAVGGGVVGDMAGFAASIYMRGIDFYNIPTTLLSEVDSSIGGKTAIDFENLKNIVGAFYPPKAVIIDPETLDTLPERHFSNGMAEAVKMAATFDEKLFSLIEKENVKENIDKIIEGSLLIKKRVVEEDEHEKGLRMVLNFGHTLAHAIESVLKMEEYFHGECVAAGMVLMSGDKVNERLIPVLNKLNLPTHIKADKRKLLNAIKHDKKSKDTKVNIIRCEEIGSYKIDLRDIKEVLK